MLKIYIIKYSMVNEPGESNLYSLYDYIKVQKSIAIMTDLYSTRKIL